MSEQNDDNNIDLSCVEGFDRSTIASQMIISEQKNGLMIAHGAQATALYADEITEMSIDTFKQEEVGKLGNVANDVYFIRDLSHGNILLTLPDHVVKYHVSRAAELPAYKIHDMLEVDRAQIPIEVFDGPLRTYSYGRQGQQFSISVIIPAGTKIRFNHTSGINIPIWLPEMLWTVSANDSGTLISGNLKVISRWENRRPVFGHPALPNVHCNGNICFGGSRLSDSLEGGNTNPTVVAEKTWMLFSGSTFNNDLLNDQYASGFPQKEVLPSIAHAGLSVTLKRILNVYGVEDGWKEVTYREISH